MPCAPHLLTMMPAGLFSPPALAQICNWVQLQNASDTLIALDQRKDQGKAR